HELRTPMTSLMMTVELLLQSSEAAMRQLSPESIDRSLYRVKHSAERLRRLTEELLDVTRIERGRLDLEPVNLELEALVRQVVEDMKFELARAGCTVRIDADDAVRGSWDRSRLEQVITNLLSNALKFGKGRPIEIRVRNAGELAEMAVRDYGVGIE